MIIEISKYLIRRSQETGSLNLNKPQIYGQWEGLTPLFMAVLLDLHEVIDLLLPALTKEEINTPIKPNIARPNIASKFENTAFSFACIQNKLETMKSFLRNFEKVGNTDFNNPLEHNFTPLLLSTLAGKFEAARLILNTLKRIDDTDSFRGHLLFSLYKAERTEQLEVLDFFLDFFKENCTQKEERERLTTCIIQAHLDKTFFKYLEKFDTLEKTNSPQIKHLLELQNTQSEPTTESEKESYKAIKQYLEDLFAQKKIEERNKEIRTTNYFAKKIQNFTREKEEKRIFREKINTRKTALEEKDLESTKIYLDGIFQDFSSFSEATCLLEIDYSYSEKIENLQRSIDELQTQLNENLRQWDLLKNKYRICLKIKGTLPYSELQKELTVKEATLLAQLDNIKTQMSLAKKNLEALKQEIDLPSTFECLRGSLKRDLALIPTLEGYEPLSQDQLKNFTKFIQRKKEKEKELNHSLDMIEQLRSQLENEKRRNSQALLSLEKKHIEELTKERKKLHTLRNKASSSSSSDSDLDEVQKELKKKTAEGAKKQADPQLSFTLVVEDHVRNNAYRYNVPRLLKTRLAAIRINPRSPSEGDHEITDASKDGYPVHRVELNQFRLLYIIKEKEVFVFKLLNHKKYMKATS